jgi:hypothetical protein
VHPLGHSLDWSSDQLRHLRDAPYKIDLNGWARYYFYTHKTMGYEQLLIGRGLTKGIDYDREVGRVKVSIKEVVPDFVLPKLSLAIEVKFAKTDTKAKTIVDEINADIQAYGRGYAHLLFIVYDLGTIRDVLEFTRDLESVEGVEVIIVKQ